MDLARVLARRVERLEHCCEEHTTKIRELEGILRRTRPQNQTPKSGASFPAIRSVDMAVVTPSRPQAEAVITPPIPVDTQPKSILTKPVPEHIPIRIGLGDDEFEKIKFNLHIRKRRITSGIDHVLDSLLIIDPPPPWGTTLLDKIYSQSYEGKNFELFDKLYELYNEVKSMARFYYDLGNIELSEKIRLEAEHIFDELKQYEDMYQDKWLKLNTMRVPTAKAHSPLFSHPGGYKSYARGGRKTRRNKKRNSFKK
jgi:hypothetical protein